jgi:hypothetical protein
MALCNPRHHHALAVHDGLDLGVDCGVYAAWESWWLAYPDQALEMSRAVLTRVQELRHSHSLVFALNAAALLHLYRAERVPRGRLRYARAWPPGEPRG